MRLNTNTTQRTCDQQHKASKGEKKKSWKSFSRMNSKTENENHQFEKPKSLLGDYQRSSLHQQREQPSKYGSKKLSESVKQLKDFHTKCLGLVNYLIEQELDEEVINATYMTFSSSLLTTCCKTVMDTSTHNNQPEKENDSPIVNCEIAPIQTLDLSDNCTVFAELSSPAIAVTEIPDIVTINDKDKIEMDNGPSVEEPLMKVDVLAEEDRTEYIYYKIVEHEPDLETEPKREVWNAEFDNIWEQMLDFNKGFELTEECGEKTIFDDDGNKIVWEDLIDGQIVNRPNEDIYTIVIDDRIRLSDREFIPRGYEKCRKDTFYG